MILSIGTLPKYYNFYSAQFIINRLSIHCMFYEWDYSNSGVQNNSSGDLWSYLTWQQRWSVERLVLPRHHRSPKPSASVEDSWMGTGVKRCVHTSKTQLSQPSSVHIIKVTSLTLKPTLNDLTQYRDFNDYLYMSNYFIRAMLHTGK